MRVHSGTITSQIELCCAASTVALILALSTPAFAGAGNAQGSTAVPEAALDTVERNLLQKTYPQDPIGKRLQKLELLEFGATQYGSESERWQQLQQALAQGKKEQAGHRSGQRKGANPSDDIASLEREILKRTFVSEPLPKRLDRLETKVFGQSTATMAAENRIERLKRATGFGESTGGPETAIMPYGSQRGDRSDLPYSYPFNGRTVPGFPDFFQGDPQMSQVLKQMEKQMRDMERFGPGRQPVPKMPGNGQFNFKFYYQGPDGKPHYYQSSPDGQSDLNHGSKGRQKPVIPGLKVPNTNEIPPYGDPNSI